MNNNYIGVDLNLFRQPKIQRLELQHGKGGVAIYIQLYLKLAESDNVINETDLPILEREFFIKLQQLKSIVYDFGLFEVKDGKIYSTIIADKLAAIKKIKKDKSKAGKLGAQKRWSNKQKHSSANGSANGSVITEPIAKNSNKIKEKKINKTKEIKETIPEQIKDLFLDWLEMRKEIKKPATAKAIELALKKLSKFQVHEQRQMLENSITNNWTDVYPLKKESKNFESDTFTNKENMEDKFKHATITL